MAAACITLIRCFEPKLLAFEQQPRLLATCVEGGQDWANGLGVWLLLALCELLATDLLQTYYSRGILF